MFRINLHWLAWTQFLFKGRRMLSTYFWRAYQTCPNKKVSNNLQCTDLFFNWIVLYTFVNCRRMDWSFVSTIDEIVSPSFSKLFSTSFSLSCEERWIKESRQSIKPCNICSKALNWPRDCIWPENETMYFNVSARSMVTHETCTYI